MPYVATYLTIGAITYPFAYYAVEKLLLKIIPHKVWKKGFSDIGSSKNLFLFVYMFCIVFNTPLLALYMCMSKNLKNRQYD